MPVIEYKTEKQRKMLEEKGLVGKPMGEQQEQEGTQAKLALPQLNRPQLPSLFQPWEEGATLEDGTPMLKSLIPYKTERQRRILARKGLAEWNDEEKKELTTWGRIGKSGYESIQRQLKQLQTNTYQDWSRDIDFRRGLAIKIREAEDYVKGLGDDSLTGEEANEYLAYLQELKKAYEERANYFGQFQDEKSWQEFEDVNELFRNANGRSYEEIYQGTVQNLENAKEKAEQAKKTRERIEDMRKELIEYQYYPSRGLALNGMKNPTREEVQQRLQSLEQDAKLAEAEENMLRDQMARAQRMSDMAEQRRYADLPTRPDYEAQVEKGREAYEQKYGPLDPGTENELETAMKEVSKRVENANMSLVALPATAVEVYKDTSYREPTGDWTQENLETFFYLYANNEENPEDAWAYASRLNDATRTKKLAEQTRSAEEWTNRSGWHRAAAWGAGVASAPFQLGDFAKSGMEYAFHGRISPHANATIADYANAMTGAASRFLNEEYGTLPEYLPVVGGKGWGDAYQLAQSIAQSALTAAAGGGVTNLLFFGSAANQGLSEAKARGATDGQALLFGTLCGAAEVLGETISIEHLISIKNPATLRQFLWNVLKQGGVEASEEAFTTLLTTFSDALVMGDKSELQQAIRKNRAAGMSQKEAEKAAWTEWANGIAFDALSGYFSGGISAGGRQAIGMIQANNRAYFGEDAKRLVELAMTKDKSSKAYQLAEKIQKKGAMSELEATQLSELLGGDVETLHKEMRTELAQEAQRRLQKEGVEEKEAARLAENMTRDLLGEEMNRRDRKAWQKDFSQEQVRRVASEMKQERRRENARRAIDAQLNLTMRKAFNASNLKISSEDMEILREGFVPGAQRMNAYVIAMRDGYRLGAAGMEFENAAASSTYAKKVMPVQFQHAWALGAKAAGKNIPAEIKASLPGEELGGAEKDAAVKLSGQAGSVHIRSLTRVDGEMKAVVMSETGEQTVSLKELDFGDDSLGDLVQVLRSRSDAEAMWKAYKSGMGIGHFVRTWDTAKAYAQSTKTANVESVLKDSLLQGMDEETIRAAFAYGRSLKKQEKAKPVKKTEAETSSGAEGASSKAGNVERSPRAGMPVRGENKGGVSYDGGQAGDMKLKAVNRARLTQRQQAQIALVEMLGKKFGIRFVLYESERGKSGRFQGANGLYKAGVIYLDVNAGLYGRNMGQVAIVRTAAHELTHYIQDHAKEQYDELKAFLLDSLVEWKGKDLGQLAAQKLARDRTGKLTMAEALDEVVADGCEMMLQRSKVMEKLHQKPGLAQTVKEWLQKWSSSVKEAFQGVSEVHDEARTVAEMEAGKLEKLLELWDKGLITAAENAAKSPAKTGGEVKYSFAGERALTADRDQLRRAQQMEKQGLDAERIRQETGWFRGMDGKWRFEIDDSGMQLFHGGDAQFAKDHPEYAEYKSLLNKAILGTITEEELVRVKLLEQTWGRELPRLSKRVQSGNATLGNILQHEALFEAYPELRDVKIRFGALEGRTKGQYSHATNTITLSGNLRNSDNGTLLHEIQHVIQHMEGFAAGASKEYWEDRLGKEYQDYTADDLYFNTAGEIEARDTAEREKLSDDERKNTRPDIDRKGVVFADDGSVVMLDADSDQEILKLKNQLKANKKRIMSLPIISKVQSPTTFASRISDRTKWAYEQLRKKGTIVDRENFGKIKLDEPQIHKGMTYARTEGDKAAFLAIHDVLKRGIQIEYHPKHKGGSASTTQDVESWTFAGHVDINGVEGIMAVIVQKTKGLNYKAHKVLMPDGSAFLLQEYKEKEESGPAQGAPENGRLVEPTDSSNNSIRSSSEESKTQFQERDELPTDRELLMTAKAEGRNAEAMTAYQKKVRSLEALERKLKRQQDALEAARSRQVVDNEGRPLDQKEQKQFNRTTVQAVQEQIRKTEASIARAEKALADMERNPQLRQETETALAAWREQNPHDAARAIREMQRERDSLQAYVKLLRQEAKLTTPENRKMLPSDIRRLAQSLVKEHGSEAAVDQIAERLQELGDFTVANMEGGGVGYYNRMVEQAKQIAKMIVDESYETLDDNREIREGIRNYLRKHTLAIGDVRGDIPDFDRWRKAHMGTLRLGNEGMDIDQAYQDLRSEFGEAFFPADVMAHSDQLQQILNALDMVQPSYHQMFSQFESWQAAESMANEIIDRLLSGEVKERESMADRAFRQRMEQLEAKYARKDKARQKALENAEDRAAWEARKRDEAEERRREERALRRQLVAEKVHELRERSIERDKKYRGRIAIDKKVVALSKIMLENSGKRHVPDAWKEAIGNFLASIDTLTQHSGEGSRSFHVERIEALREMVRKQQLANEGREERGEEQGPQVFLDINPYLADMLTPFVTMARDSSTGTIQVENLEVEQMKELEEVLTAIREAVDKSDVMLAAAEKGETLSKTAGETIRHLESLGKGKTGNIIRRFLSWDNLTPVYFFKRFGAGGERVFRELQRGWGKLAMNAKQIIDFSNGTYTAKEARAWEQEVHEFKLVKRESDLGKRESLTKAAADGGPEAARAAEERNKETVKLSTAQLMGLYCLAKREQARGHILGGGIRIWDITAKKGTQEQAERYLVTMEDIAEMTNALTERQKAVADALQTYMNTVGSTWGNEVSQKRFGVDLFTEKNYYPIQTDPMSRNARTPDADGADLFHILNMGFTKNTVKNAKNGVVIHSIFDVFSNHMADMAKYNSMGLPMLDAMKWINYRDETDGSFTSTRKAMEAAYGKNAERYFLGLMQDLNGSYEGGRRGEDIASRMISFSKVASVGANLRVAALQPTSYVRALAVLDPKYLLMGDNPARIKQGMEEAQKYSGTAVWKSLGFFDMNINSNMRDLIKHTDGAAEKIREVSMWGAEMGDKTTWGRLWNATKAEVRAKTGLSGEELMKATAARFDDVIYQTQVMDSTMTRSHLMRQKGAFAGMMTSFMSEPTLSYNLLLDAVSNWQQAKRSGKGVKAASSLAARAFITYAMSQIAASIVESIFSAMRDEDDYESLWEKWKQAEFGMDGNLVQDLVIHNKLPYVRDVVSIVQGFTNKRMDTEWVEDLTRAYKALKRDMENGEFRWGTAYAAMNALSTVTGLPISNAARDGVAIWNTFVVQSAPDWKLKTVKRGTVKPLASIKQAYQAGAISEEDAIRYLMRDAEIETEEKAKQKVFEWGLEKGTKKYDKLLDAVRSGQDSKAARDELLQAGFSEDSLRSEVRSAVKAWYQGTAEDGRPRIERDAAIRMLVKEGGMSQREAEAKVREWSSYISSPEKLQYEDIQDAYIAGEITAARAAEMRMLYGGKSKSEAQEEVQKWACEKETGIAYSNLKDAWIDGEISDSEAVEYQMKYGGQTKVNAEKTLQKWRYVKDTGGDYDDVKQGFLEGTISEQDAIDARVDYGGQTRINAQKEVRKWSCEKETGIVYDDLQDLYLSGEVSAERASQLRVTYGGQTKIDADSEVLKWRCEKETGIRYSKLQELYLGGELDGARAAELQVQYGGKTQAEAKIEVLHWQCEKDTGVKYDNIRDAYVGQEISRKQAGNMLAKYGGYNEEAVESELKQYDFAGTDPNLKDVSEKSAELWYSSIEGSGISKEQWYKAYKETYAFESDKDSKGKTIKNSLMKKRVAYIDSLQLNSTQKDLIFLAFYKESNLRYTPWH